MLFYDNKLEDLEEITKINPSKNLSNNLVGEKRKVVKDQPLTRVSGHMV